MTERMQVLREYCGSYQKVGVLEPTREGAVFSYDRGYLDRRDAHAISVLMPLREGSFGERETRAFFDGLLPEGPLRRAMSEAFHADRDDYQSLLSHLNNESAGALVFCGEGDDPLRERFYEPLPFSELESFARQPRAHALAMSATSRLSLAGAQAKVGLHHDGESLHDGWLFPRGSAPSSYIVKAADGTFPRQTINEALCMRVAERMGYETSETALLSVDGAEPLLVVKRFDRLRAEGDEFPYRRHQEDFCQATGVASALKYEPTDGNYVARMAAHLAEASTNPFGDRVELYSRLLFDWAIGNCDNHLKNHSMLWDELWEGRALSPLYDVTCTTYYSEIELEMGVSFCRSRRVCDVRLDDIKESARRMGVPVKVALAELEELGSGLPEALEECAAELEVEGYPDAIEIASFVRRDFSGRMAAALS